MAADKPVDVSEDNASRDAGCASILQFGPLSHPPVHIITSRKRRRTVTARLRSGVLELLVPASMPLVEREQWAQVMSRRLAKRAARARPSDERLLKSAQRLNQKHFAGALRFTSIGFADMERLWGSCTFTDGAIRIARRAAPLPEWVLDYLVIHEVENRYPLTERAKGYLLALDAMV